MFILLIVTSAHILLQMCQYVLLRPLTDEQHQWWYVSLKMVNSASSVLCIWKLYHKIGLTSYILVVKVTVQLVKTHFVVIWMKAMIRIARKHITLLIIWPEGGWVVTAYRPLYLQFSAHVYYFSGCRAVWRCQYWKCNQRCCCSPHLTGGGWGNNNSN